MALDAATLALTAAELKATLTDAKIAKIFEPTRDELVITLRTRTDTYALLLSARSGSARVCLTEETFENPETPPSFCMLIRKHLTGGRLLDVHMEPGDRIVYFDFQCTNEMGDLVRNTLCAELMGRYSNLVLVQSGKIIDALKRVDFEDSDVRQLLPGLPYTTPPKPARPDFLLVSSASIVAAACQRELPVADALNKTVAGVGPVVCREAAWRAFDGEHLPANELTDAQKRSLMAAIDELKELHAQGGCPCSVTAPDGKPVEYTFFRPQQYGEQYTIREWPSFNAMLEGYYAEKDRAERLRTKSKELHKAVHNMYDRALRKQAARQEELAASGKSEKLRLYGELLQANLWAIHKGDRQVTVQNYYTGEDVTIRLDPRLGGNERRGVFATRSPYRPNALGLSCVELAGVENGELLVRGADLLDGTPIFDIKPYLPYVDAYPDARGGFTDTTKEYALQVVCPDALLCKVPENKRAALSGVLKNDPRPAYQHDPERVYTLDFGCNKVKFTVDGDILKVVDIL